jgi:structural maintenance of chromosome 3 (chondroitin sulfate proteoglycan 6)
MDAEMESVNQKIQRSQKSLETLQGQQSEDARLMSKQQKTTERYLAKRQMLMSRKDECNRNIRDLGVLPEEAFEKYTNDKLEKVRCRLTRLCLIGADIPLYS